MKNNKYSIEIANTVKDFLVNDDWHFSFDEKYGAFRFDLFVKSKIKKINYLILIHNNDYTVYASSPVGADADDCDMMLKMAEFVCRANYGLRSGNFELDMRDGEIRYKTYVDCHGGMTPSKEVVKKAVSTVVPPCLTPTCPVSSILSLETQRQKRQWRNAKSLRKMNFENCRVRRHPAKVT